MRVTVLGATGYGGMLLTRLLARHPEVKRVIPAARSAAGEPFAQTDPGFPRTGPAASKMDERVRSPDEALADPGDLVFSALPHGVSAEVCLPVLGSVPVIDLSADFRLDGADRFRSAYGREMPVPDLQSKSVYGLSEWYRTRLASADLIANPGCYPTCALLPLLPVVETTAPVGPVVINALSGISGAGRKAKALLLYAERTENATAYNVGTAHRHHAEIAEQLLFHGLADADGSDGHLHPSVLFNPHLIPMKQGMAATIVVHTESAAAAERAADALRGRYEMEPFIELTGSEPPETRHIRGTNRVRIGRRIDGATIILMSVLDNLWKGAAGQAVQNMNIRFGFPETAGLSDGLEL
jgi:N-acetyl-gamma-glutamyl-phosphate reductase